MKFENQQSRMDGRPKSAFIARVRPARGHSGKDNFPLPICIESYGFTKTNNMDNIDEIEVAEEDFQDSQL